MLINVRYFASLREHLAKDEDVLAINQAISVAEIWQQLNPNHALPKNTLTAINQQYVTLTQTVQSGDEVAFFPPVTGG
jgi:molybdopterin synthase sulfur carrier subunit